MGRVSQAQAQENRRTVVRTAARLFRECGVDGVSVADVMAAAGLTHGGFYKQFASKEALVAEAIEQAYAESEQLIAGFRARDDRPAARDDFVAGYLSPAHRDAPGTGCPTAGFSADLARDDLDDAVKQRYAAGVEAYGRWLGTEDEPDLAAACTMVGALMLARATAGTDTSERILAAAREALIRG